MQLRLLAAKSAHSSRHEVALPQEELSARRLLSSSSCSPIDCTEQDLPIWTAGAGRWSSPAELPGMFHGHPFKLPDWRSRAVAANGLQLNGGSNERTRTICWSVAPIKNPLDHLRGFANWSEKSYATRVTLPAWKPFGPLSRSNSTVSPSFSER